MRVPALTLSPYFCRYTVSASGQYRTIPQTYNKKLTYKAPWTYWLSGSNQQHVNIAAARVMLNKLQTNPEQNREALQYGAKGRAIARPVSRRLPTAAARVRSEVRLCGICDGRSGTEAGFVQVLRFPFSILIPVTASYYYYYYYYYYW
jgi:hypothetical protein